MKSSLAANGFFLKDKVLPENGIISLIAACSNKKSAGIRNLFTIPQVRSFASSSEVRAMAERILGKECFAVKAIFFDKSPETNWKVTWHQDLTIAVKSQKETPNYGPWSIKDGIPHVQPPDSILEQMLAIRIHLDDCGQDNGPLRVIPGSHKLGKLSSEKIQALRSHKEVECLVPRGGALLMRPLLLHASSKAIVPSHRRVIHLEFANTELASGLEWYEKVS